MSDVSQLRRKNFQVVRLPYGLDQRRTEPPHLFNFVWSVRCRLRYDFPIGLLYFFHRLVRVQYEVIHQLVLVRRCYYPASENLDK